MKTNKYVRKIVTIDAVQVTEAAMNEISTWCGGKIIVDFEDPTKTHVKVRVIKPQDERQTQAFVGDWILKLGKSFKVYTDDAFKKGFDPAPVEQVNEASLALLKEYVNGPESKQDVGGVIRKMSSGAFSDAGSYIEYQKAKELGMNTSVSESGEVVITDTAGEVVFTGTAGEVVFASIPAEKIDLNTIGMTEGS